MSSVLHGTWIAEPDDREREMFFVWAERHAQGAVTPAENHLGPRIRRHPYAATTIEISDLLQALAPEAPWREVHRLTRVVYLPSDETGPIVPGQQRTLATNGSLKLQPWRVEGLAVPAPQFLYFATALTAEPGAFDPPLGTDLIFWGRAVRFALALLAAERFLPGLEGEDGGVRPVWLPVLDEPAEAARFELLARGMPPACRAVIQERAARDSVQFLRSHALLHSFLSAITDCAVRAWGLGNGSSAAWAWRHGLAHVKHAPQNVTRVAEIGRLYPAWKSLVASQAKVEAGSSFRLCFRLEPPVFGAEHAGEPSLLWRLRYFLQASDDLSLMVPAWEVWREQGDALSYLNRRFDNPQEKLLEGLGLAADLCPAIRRSLQNNPCPDSTEMTDQEAFQFLREATRLLEGAGFGVLVPPWWNTADTRLRVKAMLRAAPETNDSGMLSMDALVRYDWEMALGDQTLSQEEFERLAQLKTPLVQVRGRWVLLRQDQIESAVAFWEKHAGHSALRMRDALGLALGAHDELGGLQVSEVELDDTLKEVLAKLSQTQALELLTPPEGFEGTLRPYQVQGLSWLAFLRRWGFGACLADDMGLGKTIQTIALVLHARDALASAGPTLVVCPTSLVGNWQREVARFAPDLTVVVHHGTGRAEGPAFVEQAERSNLVISTYGLVRRDLHDLMQVRWANMIIDEAQNIKNPVTKQARAVRRLQADFRVALTGTPVENRLSELWSIMAFLNPGYLGSRAGFRRDFALPIERNQDPDASARLRRLVRPFILRRVKTDPDVIRDLPEKFEQRIYCNLTHEQATLYQAIVQDAIHGLRDAGPTGDGMRRRGMILAMLTRLKQICNHPALFLADGSAIPRRSGKLNRLTEMLEEILELGERTLIFTQYAQMGMLLQQHLRDFFDQEVLFLHGGTPQRQREEMLERFQNSPDAPLIFVLSLKAGGTGLNLMSANHVFHYDRWWNPAVENQATDRAYRIGQTRDVQVHKFVCLGTLEERIDALIESKRELAENVIGEGDGWVTELSTDELRDLISLRSEAVQVE